MKRLLENGLIYGNLFHVASPALVARYNRALKHLTGLETKLEDFYIDISGYSPEIADEVKDPLYLNKHGCNHQFIIVSLSQRTAPLLDSSFSTTRDILQQFIDANEEQLLALTSQDALAGELYNTIYELDNPQRLLDVHKITIEADTTVSHLEEAKQLQTLIHRFQNEKDAWWDKAIINEMMEIGKKTGNVTLQPIHLTHTEFEQKDFYTSHFGGMYIYTSLSVPTVIGHKKYANDFPDIQFIDKADHEEIGKFLLEKHMVEIAIARDNQDSIDNFALKVKMVVIDKLIENGEKVDDLSDMNFRKLLRKYASGAGPIFHGLNDILRWAQSDGRWPNIQPGHEAYFYLLRSTSHDDEDITNRLLSELTPLDLRQLFITNKPLFYKSYKSWKVAKKKFAVSLLRDEYLKNKAGVRSAIFGPHPTPEQAKETVKGPWG